MAFDIRQYLPAIVIFVGIMTAGTYIITELAATDDTFIAESPNYALYKSLDQYDELQTEISNFNNTFYAANSSSTTVWGGLSGLFTDSFNLMKRLPVMIYLPIQALVNFGPMIGIPPWIPALALSMLMLSFILWLVLALLGAWRVQ